MAFDEDVWELYDMRTDFSHPNDVAARHRPVVFSTDDTFDVGEDWGTPISPDYAPPFRFTGTLTSVTVEAS